MTLLVWIVSFKRFSREKFDFFSNHLKNVFVIFEQDLCLKHVAISNNALIVELKLLKEKVVMSGLLTVPTLKFNVCLHVYCFCNDREQERKLVFLKIVNVKNLHV